MMAWLSWPTPEPPHTSGDRPRVNETMPTAWERAQRIPSRAGGVDVLNYPTRQSTEPSAVRDTALDADTGRFTSGGGGVGALYNATRQYHATRPPGAVHDTALKADIDLSSVNETALERGLLDEGVSALYNVTRQSREAGLEESALNADTGRLTSASGRPLLGASRQRTGNVTEVTFKVARERVCVRREHLCLGKWGSLGERAKSGASVGRLLLPRHRAAVLVLIRAAPLFSCQLAVAALFCR
jgi:hypothetical protein